MAARSSTSLGLLLAAAAAAGQVDVGWELLVTNAGDEVPRTCLAARGLPHWARGAYYVSGPARFDMGGVHFQSLFDGLGRVNRFELLDEQVCYTSVWLQTGTFKQAEATGAPKKGILFEDTEPRRPACALTEPMCHLEAPNDNNWVNMVEVAGEGLLLSDTYKMVRMDLETLNVSGAKSWEDDSPEGLPSWVSFIHTPIASSAHPVRRPHTNTWVDVITEAPLMPEIGHSLIDVYTFEDNLQEQRRNVVVRFEAAANQYFHSFGVTENYVVLPYDNTVKMLPLVSTPILLDAFTPDWGGIHVVDFHGGVQVFSTDPFFHVHIVNTFENATGIVMDVGAYPHQTFTKSAALDTSMFVNHTLRDAEQNRGFVRRLHMHLSGPLQGKTTYEDYKNPGRSVDFFKINMLRSGLPYCVYYAVEWFHDGVRYANMAIVKHDLCRGTRSYWHRDDVYPGEPFFIAAPRSTAEDDGIVVFTAVDGRKGRSVFVTLDAESMKELSLVVLPVHIPFTAHGQFVPAGARDTLSEFDGAPVVV